MLKLELSLTSITGKSMVHKWYMDNLFCVSAYTDEIIPCTK